MEVLFLGGSIDGEIRSIQEHNYKLIVPKGLPLNTHAMVFEGEIPHGNQVIDIEQYRMAKIIIGDSIGYAMAEVSLSEKDIMDKLLKNYTPDSKWKEKL